MNKINTIGIHQPNYFPWLGYFNKVKFSDQFIFLDTVDIQTGNAASLTNRTKIKTHQGEQFITIPIKKGISKLIRDIEIDNTQQWRKKHLNSLLLSYKKAKAFEEIYSLIEKYVNQPFEKLADLNCAAISGICDFLELKTPKIRASELNVNEDDRNLRLISLCKQFDGKVYLSGKGGKSYNDENLFLANGISVQYTNFQPLPYQQLYGEFISGLSIIDALMNCGKATVSLIGQHGM